MLESSWRLPAEKRWVIRPKKYTVHFVFIWMIAIIYPIMSKFSMSHDKSLEWASASALSFRNVNGSP